MKVNTRQIFAVLVNTPWWAPWVPAILLSTLCLAGDPPDPEDYAEGGADAIMHYRKNNQNDTPRITTRRFTVTANHCEDHVKCSTGVLDHSHFQYDYEADGKPTAKEGNAYYTWLYKDFQNGTITCKTDCTMQGNCWSAAFHKYREGTIVNFWVDPAAGNALVVELGTPECKDPDTGTCMNYDKTKANDRCVESDSHAWWILEPPGPAKPTKCRWKEGTSGEYEWNHPNQKGNCAPKTETPIDLYIPDLILRWPNEKAPK